MEWLWVLFGFIILIAYTLEAVTGFGSIVIALSLGVLFLPFEKLLPILVCCNICMTSVLAYRNRSNIDRELLLKVIMPGMLLGTATGYFIAPYLNDVIMKQAFGALIVWFAARELWRTFHRHEDKARPLWKTRAITYSAGITHGLFASGGPLLVYAVAGTKINKARFRATMVFVWFTLNFLLTIAFLADGSLQPVLINVLFYIPVLFMAVKLGNFLHERVDERHFKMGVYWLLLLTGIILIISRYLMS